MTVEAGRQGLKCGERGGGQGLCLYVTCGDDEEVCMADGKGSSRGLD